MNNKLHSMNHNMLQESLERDIGFALQKKPSLDGLSNIHNTIVEKPFMDAENVKLNIETNLVGNNNLNEIINGQINNLKNNVLNTNTVNKVVEMNYQNKNGLVSGNINKMEIQSNDVNNLNVRQETQNLSDNKKVIKSFTIDLNKNAEIEETKSVTKNIPKQNNGNNKGIISVDEVPSNKNKKVKKVSKMKKSFKDIMNNIQTNRALTIVFLLLLIIVMCFLVKKKKGKGNGK